MAETSVAETEPLARLLAGISEAQEEELLLAYGPRKVRKAIKERRKAAGHEPGATGKESAFRIRGSLAERQAIRQVQADLERDSARRARRTRH